METLKKYTAILEKICDNTKPGKKVVQKLMYLIERKGVVLNLNYSIHFFGPYSTKLDNALHTLENKDIVKIDTSGATHVISIIDKQTNDDLLNTKESKIVDYVLSNFSHKSALDLEAITTIDYVANTIFKNTASDKEILDEVKKIKGSKFDYDFLLERLKVLKEYKYIS